MGNSKVLNIIFRIVIFICAALSVYACFETITLAIDAAEVNADSITIGMVKSMMASFKAFRIVFFGTLLGLALSFIARRGSSGISIFFRTFNLAAAAVLQFMGLKFVNAFLYLSDILVKIGKEDFSSLENEKLLSSYGYSAIEINKNTDILEKEEGIIFLLCGMFFSAFIFFVLSLTSIHSLVKSDKPQNLYNPYGQYNQYNNQYMPYQQNNMYGQNGQFVPTDANMQNGQYGAPSNGNYIPPNAYNNAPGTYDQGQYYDPRNDNQNRY